MLIEEAFKDIINSCKKSNNYKSGLTPEAKNNAINKTQFVDIRNIFGEVYTIKPLNKMTFNVKRICAPFEFNFIKIFEGKIAGIFFEIYANLVEQSPGIYSLSLIVITAFSKGSIVLTLIQEENNVSYQIVNSNAPKDIEEILFSIIDNMLICLEKISYSTHDLYKIKSQKMVFRNRATKEKIKVEKPIYIYLNKKDSEKTVKNMTNYKNRKIERIFSWNVRGHWRRLDNEKKRGKNAEGKYIVEGFTWVKPHVCGNKEARLRQQTYIVLDKKE